MPDTQDTRTAIQNPKRGKVHRLATDTYGTYVACGTTVGKFSQAHRLDVDTTAAQDRCSRCWPPERGDA